MNKFGCKNFFSLGILIAALIPAYASAQLKSYPKRLKKTPVVSEDVESEIIKTNSAEPGKNTEAKKNAGAEAAPTAQTATNTPAEGKPAADANAPPSDVKPVDSLGPRKGYLRDAGLFKVEMKTRKKGIDVFLINANQGLPITEESHIEGQLYVGKKEYELKFWPVPHQKKFFAQWPEEVRAIDDIEAQGKGVSLVILPTREHVIGAPVLYRLDKLHE